jgi:hypothetical protein
MTSQSGLLWKEGGERLFLLPSPAHTQALQEERQGEGREEVTGTLPSPCSQDRIPCSSCSSCSCGCCARQGLRCPAVCFRDLFDVCAFQQPQDSSFSRKSIHKKPEGKAGAHEPTVRLLCCEFDSACCSDYFFLIAVLTHSFADHGDLGPSIISA